METSKKPAYSGRAGQIMRIPLQDSTTVINYKQIYEIRVKGSEGRSNAVIEGYVRPFSKTVVTIYTLEHDKLTPYHVQIDRIVSIYPSYLSWSQFPEKDTGMPFYVGALFGVILLGVGIFALAVSLEHAHWWY